MTVRGPLRAPAWLRAVAAHRLVHFLVLGGCLFAVAPSPPRPRAIHVAPEQLAALKAAEARRVGKAALSPGEALDVEVRAVEDELLYREARRLGIDEGDVIVRQRMIQKLLLLTEDLDGASLPLTEEELRACFEKSAEKWRRPAAVRLIHIYGSSREALAPLREEAIAWSADPRREEEIPPLGESFPLNRKVAASIADIEAQYGPAFAAALPALPLRSFSEPLASKYGWHLVRIIERKPEGPASFEEARRELDVHCQIARREEAVRRYLIKIFPDYQVYVGEERVRELSPTRRVAARSEASQED